MRAIIKTRRERKKGKRAALKGHFHITTEELCASVIAAEEATTVKMMKPAKKPTKKNNNNAIQYIDTDMEDDNGLEEDFESDFDELAW